MTHNVLVARADLGKWREPIQAQQYHAYEDNERRKRKGHFYTVDMKKVAKKIKREHISTQQLKRVHMNASCWSKFMEDHGQDLFDDGDEKGRIPETDEAEVDSFYKLEHTKGIWKVGINWRNGDQTTQDVETVVHMKQYFVHLKTWIEKGCKMRTRKHTGVHVPSMKWIGARDTEETEEKTDVVDDRYIFTRQTSPRYGCLFSAYSNACNRLTGHSPLNSVIKPDDDNNNWSDVDKWISQDRQIIYHYKDSRIKFKNHMQSFQELPDDCIIIAEILTTNQLHHAVVIDTRHGTRLLIDGALKGPVEYTAANMRWVRNWIKARIMIKRGK